MGRGGFAEEGLFRQGTAQGCAAPGRGWGTCARAVPGARDPRRDVSHRWRAKYGGVDAFLVSQMKALEDEHRRLKRLYADLSMLADLLKGAPGRK